MKKWLVILLMLILVSVGIVYLLVPPELRISSFIRVSCPKNAVNRFMMNESNWQKWLPKVNKQNRSKYYATNSFDFNGFSYTIEGLLADRYNLLTSWENRTAKSFILVLPIDKSSAAVEWRSSLTAGMNPIERIQQYRRAVAIKKNMELILTRLQSYLGQSVNVYGFPINEVMSKDSTLVSTRKILQEYPTTDKIYKTIDELRAYITSQGARETNQPMVRISQSGVSQFQLMVAIPTSKRLNGNADISLQLFVPWKTLMATVKGGQATIDRAFKQMEVFVDDNQRSAMAVPFQLLLTDRRSEPDSSKWMTVICQPVS